MECSSVEQIWSALSAPLCNFECAQCLQDDGIFSRLSPKAGAGALEFGVYHFSSTFMELVEHSNDAH